MPRTTVSITIPCRNEEKYIGKCLQSIVNSSYPKDLLKVFVADGQSTDATRSIIEDFSEKFPFIFLIDNIKKTTPFALNLGIKASDADVRIILGAHSEIYPDFIEKNLEIFEAHPDVYCAGGIIENVVEDETSQVIASSMSSPFGVGNAHFRTGSLDGYVDTVAFGAYKKEVFERIGYFDEELIRNQDDEFNYRLILNGMKIYLSREVRSKYYVRGTYEKLKKQYYQYGYWKVFVNRKYKTYTTIRQLIPPGFVLFLGLGFLAALFSKALMISYLVILMLYLAGAVFFANRIAEKKNNIPGIVYCFLILHISYGSGYLKGILDFLILNKLPSAGSTKLTR